MPEAKKVNAMFAEIAPRYDRANRVLSACIDRYWRWRVVKKVKRCSPDATLDLATGSGDLAINLAENLSDNTQVIGMDFCEPMLECAREKSKIAHATAKLDFRWGDGLNLPLPDASIDVVTIAFGFRNFEDRHRGLLEMKRVLKPGGSLFILEFSQPYFWFKPFYYLYLKFILPKLAGWLTGKPDAYDYLAGSIENFPNVKSLSSEIHTAGFSNIHVTRLTFGIVAIHHAVA